jgi:catechol 2,3-dioxygenase-like lactoylglutathione lyase family enzyme
VTTQPQLDAVFIHVSNVAASLRWYASLLGIPAGERSHEDLIGDLPVTGPTRIILDGHNHAFGQPPDQSRPRVMFATTDIAAAMGHARAIGADPTPVEDIGSAVVTYVSDPDGNRVCLIQRK